MKTLLAIVLSALLASVEAREVGPVTRLEIEPHKETEALLIFVTHTDKQESINLLLKLANYISAQHSRSYISLESFEAPDGQTVYKANTVLVIPKDIADKYQKLYEKIEAEKRAKERAKKAI